MTRVVLAASIAAILMLFFALGWATNALLRRRGPDEAARATELAARLHAAEAACDAAQRRAADLERALEATREEGERRLAADLAEARAELSAAMEAIGEARRDAAAWRKAYEGLVAEDRESP